MSGHVLNETLEHLRHELASQALLLYSATLLRLWAVSGNSTKKMAPSPNLPSTYILLPCSVTIP